MSEVNTGAPAPAEAAAPSEAPVETQTEQVDDIQDDGSDLDMSDSQPQTNADIDAAQKAGEITKKEAQAMKKKLKLKVDGQEEEVEFDLSDEQALIRELQKSRAFDKRNKEHMSFKSQVDQMLKMLQDAPEEVLEKFGIDVDKLAETRLSRRVEEMKKDPKEIENEKMQKELEELRKEKKRIEEEKQQAEQEKLRNQAATAIENDISSALESGKSFLPKNSPWVLRTIGQYMYMAATNGYPQVSAKDVLPLVEKEYRTQFQELAGSLSEDKLEELVGKANLDRYRKSIVSKNRSKAATKPKIEDTGTKSSTKEKEAPKEKVSFRDVFNYRK